MQGLMARRPEAAGPEDPYSARRVRRSLAFFAGGKLLSVVIGFGYLLALVRALEVRDYAGYIILIAVLELTLLVSNAGVYAFALRYITEARMPERVGALPRLIWSSLAYRVATLLLAAGALVYWRENLAGFVGQPAVADALALYWLVIVFEGASRYLELVFDSMLEQARSQFSAVLRYGARFGMVAVLVWRGDRLDLQHVVVIEAIAFVAGFVLSLAALAGALDKIRRTHRGGGAQGRDQFGLRRVARFALPLFVAQVLTQVYGADTVKLLISRLLGAMEAAAFGFAHAMSLMLQRYLPANLLIGLIRPVLVARRADGAEDAQLVAMGNLIVKVNHFLLVPVAALFAIGGRQLALVLSGGRYPDAGLLLFLLTCFLFLQALHVVLSVIATAIEDRRAVLIATIGSIPGIGLGAMLVGEFGAIAMALGLWLSECLWCAISMWLLRQRGFHFRVDWAAWLKLGGLGAVAASCAALLPWSHSGLVGVATDACVLGAVYLALCAWVKPFSQADRDTINRLLPRPLFIF